jgi:ADP-ribose pyrophosphatase
VKKIIPSDAVLVPENAKRVFEGVIYDVYQWQQKMFDESSATFEMLRRPDTVQIICSDNNKLLVLEEEQPHAGRRTNFAGGRVDEDDESILSAAKREVLEETGLTFNNWKLLDVVQPHAKFEWFIYTYLASAKLSETDQKLDNGEKVTLLWLDFEEVRTRILNGEKHLNESAHIIERAQTYHGLINLEEYKGKTIEM